LLTFFCLPKDIDINIIEYLTADPLFYELSAEDLKQLVNQSSQISLHKDEIVFEQYADGDSMYFIMDGDIIIYFISSNKHFIKLADLSVGEHFGEQSLLPGSTGLRSACAKAKTACTLLKISRDTFLSYFRQHTAIVKDLKKYGENQLRHALAQESALFRSIPLRDDVGHWLEEKMYSSGDIIFKENTPGDNFYLVLSGSAETYTENTGKEEILSQIGPGGYFGELSLLNKQPRLASVRAKTDLLTLALCGEKFRSIYKNSPKLQAQLQDISDIYQTNGNSFISLHPCKLLDMEATTAIYHTIEGIQFSLTKVNNKPIMSLSSSMHEENDSVREVFETPKSGIYREIILSDEKIIAANCHGFWDEIPHLLASALHRQRITPQQLANFRTRGELIGKNHDDANNGNKSGEQRTHNIICECTGTSKAQLLTHIAHGCETVSELSDKTGAAKICGSCKSLLADLFGQSGTSFAKFVHCVPIAEDTLSCQFKPIRGEFHPRLPGDHINIETEINGQWTKRSYALISPLEQTQVYEVMVAKDPVDSFSAWLLHHATDQQIFRISKPRGNADIGEPNVSLTKSKPFK